jgi:hypothetical protein
MEKTAATMIKKNRLLFYCISILVMLLLFILLLPQPQYTDGFKTLKDLQEYAATHDEFVPKENSNILNPTYEKYYQKKFHQTPVLRFYNKINYLLSKLSLKKNPPFSVTFFQAILNSVTQERINHKWHGSFVQKIDLSLDSKLVVFGPIGGAFHGMIRYLEKLKELSIIDENLRILKPHYYLVFLGNITNKSPYMLEILSVMLRLLKSNPYNVIYLRGRHEFQTYWKNHSLGRELELASSQLHCPPKQLAGTVESFFTTTPLKLFCTIPADSTYLNYFVVSPFIEDEKIKDKLGKMPTSAFLSNKKEQLVTLNLDKNPALIENQEHQPLLKAIVTDIKQRAAYDEMDGLRLLPPIGVTIAWTVFSSTTETYRKALNFFYDAFVVITPAKELKSWTITLYNRDIRKADKGFKTRSCYFFTGDEVDHLER